MGQTHHHTSHGENEMAKKLAIYWMGILTGAGVMSLISHHQFYLFVAIGGSLALVATLFAAIEIW